MGGPSSWYLSRVQHETPQRRVPSSPMSSHRLALQRRACLLNGLQLFILHYTIRSIYRAKRRQIAPNQCYLASGVMQASHDYPKIYLRGSESFWVWKNEANGIFTARCYAERGIANTSCLSVRLSVCNVDVSWSRLEFLENNFTA